MKIQVMKARETNQAYSHLFSDLGNQQKNALTSFLLSVEKDCTDIDPNIILAIKEVGDLVYYLTDNKPQSKVIIKAKLKLALSCIFQQRLKESNIHDEFIPDFEKTFNTQRCLLSFVREQGLLVVYNLAQWMARKLALSVGRREWASAEKSAKFLLNCTDKSDLEWSKFVTEHSVQRKSFGDGIVTVFRPTITRNSTGDIQIANLSKSV